MNARLIPAGLVSLSLLSIAAAWAMPQPPAPAKAHEKAGEEADEETIDLAKAPEPVRAAAIKLAGSEKAIKKVIKEEDEKVFTYEVEYTADNADCSAVFSAAGDLMELEKGTTEAKLPAAAMEALRKEFANATFKAPAAVQKFYYEVEVVVGGKTHEVKVDAAGNIEDEHGGKGEEEEHGKGERHEGNKGHDKD